MRIGFSDGETLEETFVNGVEELLTFAPTFNAPGGQFDRYVETVQDLEKFATVEGTNGQDINDFLDLCRYDVAPDEVRVVEDSTEESLGEKVLDKHFVDGNVVHLRVNGVTTELREIVEGDLEFQIALMLFFNNVEQGQRMFWDTFFEFVNRLFKVLDIRLDIGEEVVQQVDDIVGDIQPEGVGHTLFVLVQDGDLAVLKDSIGQGILVLDLFRDFFLQIGRWSLGLPIAASNTKLVQHDAIRPDLA